MIHVNTNQRRNPQKDHHYRYTTMPQLLNTVIRGNPTGPTVVFIHGWPDTDAVFEKQYEHLEATYRLVSLRLPFYHKIGGTPELSSFLPTPGYFGFTLDQVTEMVIDTIQDPSVTVRGLAPFLIAHDWGAIFAYMALKKVPTLARKLVALDIGQHSKPTPKGILILITYQWTLILAFLLPRFLGNALTKLVANVFHAPGAQFVHAGMNYLYFQTWKLLLTGKAQALQKWAPPTVPILYMYGQNKPLFFHSDRWLKYVEELPGSKVVSFPGDHWFFLRRKSVEAVNAEIAKFLQSP